MTLATSKLLIKGVTPTGHAFRPSDWAERMCGNLSSFRNRRIFYSPLLRPAIVDGHRCVVIDRQLAHVHPKLYEEVITFAEENHLQVCDWLED